MCKGKHNCKCMKAGASFRVDDNARLEKLDGRDYAVFAVVMAKPDVVMNGSLFPVEEYFVDAWTGVPVTITHPETDNGSFLNASDPKALEQFCVGRLFNVSVRESDLALIGEAWIDVEKIQRVDAETFAAMQMGMPLDVSTGFYSAPIEESGEVGGEKFSLRHTGVIPNHLALLPNEDGACSWDAGCGVRVNKKGHNNVTIKEALAKLEAARNAKKAKKAVKHAEPDDKSKLIDAMVSADDSPFGDDDKEALAAMSDATLAKMADMYCKPAEENAEEVVEPDGDEAAAKNADIPAKDEKKDAMNKKDRDALAFANRQYDAHKKALVARVVANTKITEAAANKMDVETLESIANGIAPVAGNYSGVALPVTDDTKSVANSMASGGVVAMLKKKA